MVASMQSSTKSNPGVTKLMSVQTTRETGLSDDASLHFHLTNILQSSLDLKRILRLFLDNVQDEVALDGLSYNNESLQMAINIGKQSTHSCGYRLSTAEDYLGEISFKRSKRFNERDLETVENLLALLICPIRNAIKYTEATQAALKDPLTGAGNRTAMDATLSREIDLAKRHNEALSILLLDVDEFKKLNDTYGHTAGDMVLKEAIEKVKTIFRGTDMIFRYGGEEFVILLNKTCQSGAKVIAEKIRKAIADMKLESNKQVLKTTVSIGIATLTGTDTVQSFLERADKAMYKAKSKGRNQYQA